MTVLSETELTADVLKKDPKQTRAERERILIGQNRTKCANFQGSPFSKLRTTLKQKKTNNSLSLCQLDAGMLA